jgi:hypothetical protein
MSKYFDCKIKYRKIDGNGVQKVTTESYIIDALTFSEAEANIQKEMSAYISEEFKVTNIKVANYSEIIKDESGDRWFKAKVSLIAFDEESGKEKKQNIYLLVQANTAKEAYDNTVLSMRNTMGDYSVPSVSETSIMDVFEYLGE